MTLLYRSQRLNQDYGWGRRRETVDDLHMKKFGHVFDKPYEVGDEHLFFCPEKQHDGYIVYHRYKHYEGKPTCYAYACYCHQGGNICSVCAPLNTTSFLDIKVPIDVERFMSMKNILRDECHMTKDQVYNWLSFWLYDILPKRYSHQRPIFFYYYRSSFYNQISTPYSFLSFLYNFVSKRQFKKKYGELAYDTKPSFLKISDDRVQIRTLKALFKWSIEVYSQNRYIIDFDTQMNRRKSFTVFRCSSDSQHDRSSRRWKQIFDTCVVQIRDEVAFRPGKIGMTSACEHFQHSLLLL